MFEKPQLLNFFNLENTIEEGGKKTPLELSIKNAHLALSAGRDSIVHGGVTVPCDVTSQQSRVFRILGSISARASIFETQSTKGQSNYVVLSLGLSSRSSELNEGVETTQTRPIEIRGRVTQAKGGDPTVYFFDPVRESYLRGYADCLRMMSRVLDPFLRKTAKLGVLDLVDKKNLEELQKARMLDNGDTELGKRSV